MEIRWLDGLSIAAKAVPAHVAALLNRPIMEFAAGIRPLRGEEHEAAVAEFKSTLRALVDQWIESGRANVTVTGDEPLKRDVIWRSPLYPKALFETVVARFWEAHPSRVTVEPNGSLVQQVGIPESAGSEDSLRWAREKAIFEFARLLDSPSPQRLSRCDGCGRYFVRQRVPVKAIYHGTFCAKEKCKHKGGAKRIVDRREQLARDKIRWAADALVKWKPGKRCGEKKDWIRKTVNEELRMLGLDPIEVNWVTWHQEDIEAEVERRKENA